MLQVLQKFGNIKGLHNKHYLVIRIMNIYEATYMRLYDYDGQTISTKIIYI